LARTGAAVPADVGRGRGCDGSVWCVPCAPRRTRGGAAPVGGWWWSALRRTLRGCFFFLACLHRITVAGIVARSTLASHCRSRSQNGKMFSGGLRRCGTTLWTPCRGQAEVGVRRSVFELGAASGRDRRGCEGVVVVLRASWDAVLWGDIGVVKWGAGVWARGAPNESWRTVLRIITGWLRSLRRAIVLGECRGKLRLSALTQWVKWVRPWRSRCGHG